MEHRAEKRPLPDGDGDSDGDERRMEKRPRFPKGKKQKRVDDAGPSGFADDEFIGNWADPLLAAKVRAKRRNRNREDELFREGDFAVVGEVEEDATAFEDYDVQIEPFNLKQERKEGYFDLNGNFVEFASRNEIKDAWLDNVDIAPRFTEQEAVEEEDSADLSSEDVGKIKRSIANSLQPGETIIQALKRLKGSSGDKKGKMNEMTKCIFDQLTEDAMKLMGNGEYNVYHEERETFVREAEGYERLARVKQGILESEDTEDIFSDGTEHGAGQPSIWEKAPSTSEANGSSLQVLPTVDEEKFDMFGDEDTETNLQSGGNNVDSSSEQLQTTSAGEAAGEELDSDYVYDPSTGFITICYSFLSALDRTTTAAARAIIMTQLPNCIVVLHQGHGTLMMGTLAHTLKSRASCRQQKAE